MSTLKGLRAFIFVCLPIYEASERIIYYCEGEVKYLMFWAHRSC